jgi:hypothetical protein
MRCSPSTSRRRSNEQDPVGEKTKLKKPFGVVLNPKNKEVIVSDMRNQGVLMFSVPEIF